MQWIRLEERSRCRFPPTDAAWYAFPPAGWFLFHKSILAPVLSSELLVSSWTKELFPALKVWVEMEIVLISTLALVGSRCIVALSRDSVCVLRPGQIIKDYQRCAHTRSWSCSSFPWPAPWWKQVRGPLACPCWTPQLANWSCLHWEQDWCSGSNTTRLSISLLYSDTL